MLDNKEKIQLLDGRDIWRLKDFGKLKSLMVADGPHGMRTQTEFGDNLGVTGSVVSVAYPTASNLASSFSKKIVAEMAATLALDARSQGVGVVLGPAINIKRNPLCGRNFEYFSEDPYLTGVLANAYIKAMEATGIGTSVKHFFANNQEKYRYFIDAVVDERTLHEIYLKAFRFAVNAKPATIMASYNKINGIHGTGHPIIENVLRNKWGYEGVVVSDWGSVTNRVSELKAGLDLQMPTSFGYHAAQIEKALKKDASLMKYIDKSSTRLLKLIERYGDLEVVKVDLDKHHAKAVKFAEEGLVLLENKNNILPLKKTENVALIGGFTCEMRYQGGGSSYINAYKVPQVKEIYESYFSNAKVSQGYHLNDFANDEALINEALSAAKTSDKVIYFMGLPERLETEGIDRADINLPSNQLYLLDELLKVNQNIIVVLLTGSVVDVSFKDRVQGLLLSYLAGEGSSEAILNTLIAKNNPSGRLPETWIKRVSDLPFKLNENNNAVYYDETIYVGYRYFSTFDQPVNYPFGYGLSYAKLEYSNFKLEELKDHAVITFTLNNESDIAAQEVIQVYSNILKSHTYRAKKELVAFDKVTLKPRETKEVSISVNYNELKYFDVKLSDFVLEQGDYNLILAHNVNDEIKHFKIKVKGHTYQNQVADYEKLYEKLTFKEIIGHELPPENIVYKKPFTLNSPLKALKKSLIGKLIVKFIIAGAVQELEDVDSWVSDNIKHSLEDTPLRCIASFGAGAINYEMAEGLVRLANGKLFTGYKKFKAGTKKLKEQAKVNN
ncbi:MAG TPA: glycoside hydrolase family 3 C-terminal domain-containing protein [Bacilli bacterium]|nr:glycoside hydrolase family 3 C-terminal domain-containing protein [Bacilli bacterium]